MDTLNNLGEVVSALADYKTAVTELGKKLYGGDVTLSTNKTEINTAWKSENATAFLGQYAELITYITEAYDSLVSYQAKISNVVAKFQGFDTTIQQGE